MRYNFEDLGDLLLPNSSNSISWNELDLDSVGELKLVDCFEQSPVFSPTIIFSNLNRGLRLASDFDRNSVSPTLILNDYGGVRTTADKNAWEEVKGEKFRLELSKMACESNHRSLDVQRQEWRNFHFPDYPNSKIKLDLDSYGNIWSGDAFERNPVPPTLTFNNGGDGTVEEIFREGKDFPTFVFNNNGRNGTVQEYIQEVQEREFSLRISHLSESSHRHFGGGRQQLQNFRPIVQNFLHTPNSGVKLTFDSNDEIWSFDDFERSPNSPNLILTNNRGDGTVEENSWDEKVSHALILNNNGGDGTVQENTREEVEGRKFPSGVSFRCPRQNSENFHRVSPNFPVGDDEIIWLDNFDRDPVSTTFFLNDNGGNGAIEENNWEDEALDFSEKAPKSGHRSLSRQREQLYPRTKCMHCLSEETPQWRSGPMGPKTLCNACGIRYNSNRLLPEYRPAGSPSFDSLKHSNFHRKIVKNCIRN